MGRLGVWGLAAGALAAGALAVATAAWAASVTVAQRGIAFAPGTVSVKAGDTVVFVNEDQFGHNVYSESAGGEFDIGRQQPGQRSPVQFKRAGSFDVYCRIHPKMHLTVTVER
jgi:plastocyanin